MKTIHIRFTKDKIAFAFLCMYAFVVPLGTVFRFGTEEGSLGISTILILFLVIAYILKTTQSFFKKKVFFVLLLLVLWFSFSTLFTPEGIISGYKRLIGLVIYILLAITITQIDLSAKRLKIFFVWLTVGMLLSSGLTLIDFIGIVDIPLANELHISTHISGGNVIQASGFFSRRSAMAAYFALVVPALIPLFTSLRNTILKIIIQITYFGSLLVLFLTHNLGGIIAILISYGLYLLWGDRINFIKRMKKIVVVGLVFISFGCLVINYFPDAIEVYLIRLSIPSAIKDVSTEQFARQMESDYMRLYFLSQALEHLAKNPIGNGYTQIWTEKYGLTDPHNIITQFLWGAGIFSFVWLGLFGYLMIKLFVLKISPHNDLFAYFDALRYGLLSWFITGMAHTIICTGLAWIFFGMMLNIRARCYVRKQKREKRINRKKLAVAF